MWALRFPNTAWSVEKNKIDGDPAATDGQVPDAPARPMMEENAASNRRYQYLPPKVAWEEYKNVGDPAATAAHGAQAPDLPVRLRPTVEENVTFDKGQELLPPEGHGAQRGSDDSKDKAETSEEQRAEAELQGEPDPSTQKRPSVIKSIIPVATKFFESSESNPRK